MGGSIGGLVDSAIGISTFGLVDTDFSGEDAGRDAARATQAAADAQARAQMEALKYLKETEALPQQFRESALQMLGGAYGAPGDVGSEQFMQRAKSSPLYQAIRGNLPQQEEAILRNQSATGARTGATDKMLAENARQNEVQALSGVLSGLQGLASIPSNANTIANQISGIGGTQAAGIQGAAQARQMAQQQGMGNLMGLGELGLAAFSAFCDPRLKEDATLIAVIDGIQIYKWKWNKEAEKLGLVGEGVGPMADEIQRIMPDRVTKRNGYLYVEAA